ncbi:MAG: hypothetical protein H6733_12095 [Alphaproteobacteria bacterium]|nr:hypothetical protein [Alphaproteobacteria bacterium]
MVQREQETVRFQDASREPRAFKGARRDKDLERALERRGFRRLGVVRTVATGPLTDPLVPADGDPDLGADGPVTHTDVVHVAPDGDAFVEAAHVDGTVWLRLRTVLDSGVIVETRVLPEHALPARRMLAGIRVPVLAGGDDGDRATRMAVDRGVESLLERLFGETPERHWPDRPGCGIRHQLVPMARFDTVWKAHVDWVTQVLRPGEDVVDHRSMRLFFATLRRSGHVEDAHSEVMHRITGPLGAVVMVAGVVAMVAALLLLGLDGVSTGLVTAVSVIGGWVAARWLTGDLSGWWLLVAVPVMYAVQARTGVPMAWVALGALAVLGLWVFKDVVVVAAPMRLGAFVKRRLAHPKVVPLPDLLDVYRD